MTRTRTDSTTIRLLLAMTATLALTLGLAFAGPAAAQFVDESETADEQADDEAPDQEADAEASADEPAPESPGDGFVGNDHDGQEAAPVGGIDAGFGGASEQAPGFGASHASALALLGLVLAGHAVNARRTASARP